MGRRATAPIHDRWSCSPVSDPVSWSYPMVVSITFPGLSEAGLCKFSSPIQGWFLELGQKYLDQDLQWQVYINKNKTTRAASKILFQY